MTSTAAPLLRLYREWLRRLRTEQAPALFLGRLEVVAWALDGRATLATSGTKETDPYVSVRTVRPTQAAGA